MQSLLRVCFYLSKSLQIRWPLIELGVPINDGGNGYLFLYKNLGETDIPSTEPGELSMGTENTSTPQVVESLHKHKSKESCSHGKAKTPWPARSPLFAQGRPVCRFLQAALVCCVLYFQRERDNGGPLLCLKQVRCVSQ